MITITTNAIFTLLFVVPLMSSLKYVIINGRFFPKSTYFTRSKGTTHFKASPMQVSVNLTPKLIIFDLDGCLWRPEMYELLMFGDDGSPFREDSRNPKALISSTGTQVRLIGDVRRIMFDLKHNPQWSSTRVGISSRTDEPDWARELLEKFIIDQRDCVDTNTFALGESPDKNMELNTIHSFPLKDAFTPELCEIAKDSKVQHFKRILKNAGSGTKMEDILFFDNEMGNCRQVASLGVTVCYCPEGVTTIAWDLSISKFPAKNGQIIRV